MFEVSESEVKPVDQVRACTHCGTKLVSRTAGGHVGFKASACAIHACSACPKALVSQVYGCSLQEEQKFAGGTWPAIVQETIQGAINTSLLLPTDQVVSIYHRYELPLAADRHCFVSAEH